MINCSVCGKKQMVGSVFCANCGVQLVPELIRYKGKRNYHKSPNPSLLNRTSADKEKTWVSLYNMENEEIFPLPNKNEITIGRYSDDHAILPDIDLSRFDALKNGISRLHCVLKNNNGKKVVSDLGSANGTFLNGSRLIDNLDTPFRHGDILTLGKLYFQLILHKNN